MSQSCRVPPAHQLPTWLLAYGGIIRWGDWSISRMLSVRCMQSGLGQRCGEARQTLMQNQPLFTADKINTTQHWSLQNDGDGCCPCDQALNPKHGLGVDWTNLRGCWTTMESRTGRVKRENRNGFSNWIETINILILPSSSWANTWLDESRRACYSTWAFERILS